MSTSKWKCRECGSENVQISLPAWYRETMNANGCTELEYVETDYDSDPMYWHCEDCEEGGRGFPDRTQEGKAA